MTKAEELAEFISALSYDSLPEAVISKVKTLFLDFLRLSILGASLPWSKIAYKTAMMLKGRGESTILYYGDMVAPPDAAFANGSFAHGLEWDDVHIPSISHPGAPTLPSAVAMAEKVHVDGAALMTAAVAGYETMIRIGEAVQPSHFGDRGFHGTATLGVFGSAAAASKILGLGVEETANALSISASYSSGLYEFFRWGTTVKRIHAGKSSQSGIWAALLAMGGITGPPTIFEGRMGYLRAYTDRCDISKLTEDLGGKYKILEVGLKTHACSRDMYNPIEAVQRIIQRYNIDESDIRRITVGTASYLKETLSNYAPQDVAAAQVGSLPFTVALAIIKRRGFLEFQDYAENIRSPEVLRIAEKIEIQVDAEMDARYLEGFPSRVTVELKDGSRLTEESYHPKGDPENPMTQEEIEERFVRQTSPIIGRTQAATIVDVTNHLERLDDVQGLCRLTVTSKEAS